MTEAKIVTIGSSGLTADVSSRGAELVRLEDDAGRALLWDGDPAYWNGRAPILFPIVGRLKDDQAKVDGVAYPMRQHGFARTSIFALAERDAASCRFRLTSDAETRKVYPFDFVLDVTYRVAGTTLSLDVTALNTGSRPMPVSAGFHPAFRWPLPPSHDRMAHTITFEKDEPEPIHQVIGGLLSPKTVPTPVQGRVLALDDDLFKADALIFLAPHSRSVRLGAPGGPSLRVDFPTMPQLGIWSKPGAGFVCIEPWSGYASPEGFDGDLAQKPGMTALAPGEAKTFGMAATLEPA